MPIETVCSACETRFTVQDDLLGRPVRCPDCKEVFVVRSSQSAKLLDPRWLSSTVLDVARNIREKRAFEILPILADALMDAGCDDEEILNHCRTKGTLPLPIRNALLRIEVVRQQKQPVID